MREQDIMHNADFLSIALEQIESKNFSSSQEFVEDVRINMLNNNREKTVSVLDDALEAFREQHYGQAYALVGDVHDKLIAELDL
jgi:hypothetical protein